MLTLRERALGAANEALSVGRGRVLGADHGEVLAARLRTAQRARQALEAALAGPPRILPREADDAGLKDALARVDRMARDLQADISRHEGHLSPR